jgi:predicted phage terminase large subunit-like protein
VLPECDPDMKAFVVDVAWGGTDSLSMPICYVYGEDWYIVDWLFDKRDKGYTMPRMIGKILHHKPHKGQFESNNGGREYADEIDRQLRTDHDYRCNITSQKAPNNVSKMARIEQYAPDIKNIYFLAEQFWDDDYRRAMNELTSLSYTTKNLHDDSPDSLAQLVAYLSGGVKAVKVFKRPF